ncbi:MAG: hypothetical protein J0M11_06990 [Anaerolineae bacterium]|nr:hypothetical protein [Anaerolineae bacterium]
MNRFDEYKYFGDRALYQSQRRQNASQLFLTVNTAIFGAIALLTRDSGLHGWVLVISIAPLFAVGVSACIIWISIISRFKKIIGWYYQQLREMENDIKGSYKFFTKEWSAFSKLDKRKVQTTFSDLETFMPMIFIGLYLIYGIGLCVSVINKTI